MAAKKEAFSVHQQQQPQEAPTSKVGLPSIAFVFITMFGLSQTIISVGSANTDPELSSLQISPKKVPIQSATFNFTGTGISPLNPPTPAGKGYCILAHNVSGTQLETFRRLNSGNFEDQRLWLSHGVLFYEFAGVTSIHEAANGGINSAFNEYNGRLRNVNGKKHSLVSLGATGVSAGPNTTLHPDFSWKTAGRRGDSNIVGEVAYGQSLRTVHKKIQDYFLSPTILVVILVDIQYPWAKEGGQFNVNDGRMTVYYYDRSFPVNTPTGLQYSPRQAISFGNSLFTQAHIDYAVATTGITAANISGYVEAQPIPCIAANLPEFALRVPGSVLLVANEGDAMSIINEPSNAIPPAFDLLIDLFDVKELVVSTAIPHMNERIAAGYPEDEGEVEQLSDQGDDDDDDDDDEDSEGTGGGSGEQEEIPFYQHMFGGYGTHTPIAQSHPSSDPELLEAALPSMPPQVAPEVPLPSLPQLVGPEVPLPVPQQVDPVVASPQMPPSSGTVQAPLHTSLEAHDTVEPRPKRRRVLPSRFQD